MASTTPAVGIHTWAASARSPSKLGWHNEISDRHKTVTSRDAVLADKGYDADAIRVELAERQIEPVILGGSHLRVKIEYHRALHKQRKRIERIFGHLKINRAIATRHDQ